MASTLVVSPASAGVRIGAYLLDLLPTLLVMPIVWIPIIGQLFGGLLLFTYWLMRDAFGRSLGKKLLGLEIRKDGDVAPTSALVLRNVPLSMGFLLYMLPLAGYVLFGGVHGVMVLVEVILLVSSGSRLGDRLAGTTVVALG